MFIHPKAAYKQMANRLTARLSKCRADSGLTITQLANRMGIHRSLIYNHENNSCSMSVITFLRLCDALAVKPENLIKDLTAPPIPPSALKV